MVRNKLIIAIIFLLACCNTNAQEIFALRKEIASLHKTVDSLQRELARYGAASVSRSSFSDLSSFDAYEVEGSLVDYWGDLSDTEVKSVSIDSLNRWLNIPVDNIVDKYVAIYTITKRGNMIGIINRFDRYKDYIYDVFEQYDVPTVFAELCIVESAVNPNANSKAGAAGMWQIMETTAREYGLTVNLISDERYDVRKSTIVAAKYLAHAYEMFGNWTIAIMSYNCGIGAMQNAIQKAGADISYDNIVRFVPRETQEYIPALLSAMYVNNNREILIEY